MIDKVMLSDETEEELLAGLWLVMTLLCKVEKKFHFVNQTYKIILHF